MPVPYDNDRLISPTPAVQIERRTQRLLALNANLPLEIAQDLSRQMQAAVAREEWDTIDLCVEIAESYNPAG